MLARVEPLNINGGNVSGDKANQYKGMVDAGTAGNGLWTADAGTRRGGSEDQIADC